MLLTDAQTDGDAFLPCGVGRALVTGMSATGKATALAALRRQGFQVVDTDLSGWTEWWDEEAGYIWREDRIAELFARDCDVAPVCVRDCLESGPVLSVLRCEPERARRRAFSL